jgi:hypothetical protein
MRWLKAIAIFLLAGAAAAPAAADVPIPPGEERFKLNIGTIVARPESTLRLDGQARGRDVDLEETIGLDRDVTTLDVELSWRFAARHRFGLRAFQLKRDAERAISETIQLEDQVIPVNTTLAAESRTTLVLADYRYSFVKNPRLEFAGSIGVLAGRYQFEFGATSPAVDIDRSATVPAPVLGARLDYFFTTRWTGSVYGHGAAYNIGDVDARVYYAGVSTEYMITRHIGLGVGFDLIGINLEVERSGFRGEIDLRTQNVSAFLQARF